MDPETGNPKLRKSKSDEIADLADILGFDALEAMFRHFAGWDTIHIPVRGYSDDALAQIIGADKVAALCENFGGLKIRVSGTARDLARQRELHKLDAAVRAGDRPSREIAQAFGCSPRWVRMRAAKMGVRLPVTERSDEASAKAPVDYLSRPDRAKVAAEIKRYWANGIAYDRSEIALKCRVRKGLVTDTKTYLTLLEEETGVTFERAPVKIAAKPVASRNRVLHEFSGRRPGRRASTTDELLALGMRPQIVEAIRASQAETGTAGIAAIAGRLNLLESDIKRVADLLRKKRREEGVAALPAATAQHLVGA